MDLTVNRDDADFREEVRDWLSSHVPSDPRASGADGAEFDRNWQRTLYDGGWGGVSWPVEYGGRGLSLVRQLIWFEEYSKAGGPAPGTLFVALAHAGPTLILLGTDDQKKRHLEAILRGDEIWCQGFSEPGSGSDLASIGTRGRVDGDSITVRGQKIWTSFATHARYQELLVRTDPESKRHKGLSWVICDMSLPGIEIHPIRQMTGGAEFCSVFYDDVKIPVSNVVGEVGGGWATAMATLGFERGTSFIGDVTEMTLQVDDLIEYVRENLGPRAGARYELAMEKLLTLKAEIAGLRALCYANISRYLDGAVPGAEGSIVKLYASQLMEKLSRTAIDLFDDETVNAGRFGHWYDKWLRSITLTIGGGTADIQREIIADRLLQLPRSR